MLKNSINKVGVFMINLTLVYIFEYVCTTCWADRAHLYDRNNKDWFIANAYAVLSFTYQLGVFLSRTSVKCF